MLSPSFEMIALAVGGLLVGAFVKGPKLDPGKRWVLWWVPNNLVPVVVFGAGAVAGEFWLHSVDAMQGGLTAVGLATPAAELLQLLGVSKRVAAASGKGGAMLARCLVVVLASTLVLASVSDAGIFGGSFGKPSPADAAKFAEQGDGVPPIEPAYVYITAGVGAVFDYMGGVGDSLATEGQIAYETPGGFWFESGAILVGEVNPSTVVHVDVGKRWLGSTLGTGLYAGGSVLRNAETRYGVWMFAKQARVILPWLEARVRGEYTSTGGLGVRVGFLINERLRSGG